MNGLGREQRHACKSKWNQGFSCKPGGSWRNRHDQGHCQRLQDRPSHLLLWPPGHLQYRAGGERQSGRANFHGECVPIGNEGSASGWKPKPLRGQAGTSLVATDDIESVVLAWRSRPNPPRRVLRLMPTPNVRFRPHPGRNDDDCYCPKADTRMRHRVGLFALEAASQVPGRKDKGFSIERVFEPQFAR